MTESTITLTERAASHVRNFLAKQGEGIGLRVGVKPTGCSGYQYVIEAANSINEQDQIFESNGVKIVIDEQSLKYLAGTELDYVRQGLNEGFKFSNPNVGETCGCGESFSVTESVQ
ncbi:MAG: iron-sulfur cluster assembly protein IscA [Gammaproteobacteria bacterium]